MGTLLISLVMLALEPTEPRALVFLGGGDPWKQAEYSQWMHLKAVAEGLENLGYTADISFADGARSETAFREETVDENGSPNLQRLENYRRKYLRASAAGNIGPATRATLKEFIEGHPVKDLLLIFLGHGLPGAPDGSLRQKISRLGFGNINEMDSIIVGWHFAKDEDDARRTKEFLDFRISSEEQHPGMISTEALSQSLQFRPEKSTTQIIATTCYSGGLAWFAFENNRQILSGDRCAWMAAPYYEPSSGCTASGEKLFGAAYEMSKLVRERTDVDEDGNFSLNDIHWGVMSRDQVDQTGQLTSEVFLQQAGYLSWPRDSRKPISIGNKPKGLKEIIPGPQWWKQRMREYLSAEETFLKSGNPVSAQRYLMVRECELKELGRR